MDLLRRLLGHGASDRPADDTSVGDPLDQEDEAGGVGFRELIRQLASPDERARQDIALLLSGLGYRGAIRPLIRAYLRHADPVLLDALRPFGARLTPEAARELRDVTLSPTERARLMDILGASGDPGAVAIARHTAREGEMVAHIAACVALAALGDREGVQLLDEDLLRMDATFRSQALEALVRIDDPAATAAAEEHVRRYLAGGGAIPAEIKVTMPVLIDPDDDLAEMAARHIRDHPRRLTIVTGPGVDGLAERKREVLARLLPGHQLLYSTARHSRDEQIALLERARDRAAESPTARSVLIGRLPSPEGHQPAPHFLTRTSGRSYAASIVIVGPQKPALVLEWWRYVVDRAEVPTDMVVVLTTQVLGHSELTVEESAIQRLAGDDRRDEYARAVLAHL